MKNKLYAIKFDDKIWIHLAKTKEEALDKAKELFGEKEFAVVNEQQIRGLKETGFLIGQSGGLKNFK